MNPRTDYSDADPQTARAFFELFKRHDEDFQFGIDGATPDDEELTARLSVTDHGTLDGRSSILVSGVNMSEQFADVAATVREMGLTFAKEDETTEEADTIGEYTSSVLVAYAPEEIDAAWNVPHLLVYGSLSPEFEEAIQEAVGTKFEFTNVRNHVLIWGEELSETHRTKITDTVQRASYMFDDDKRFLASNLRTAEHC